MLTTVCRTKVSTSIVSVCFTPCVMSSRILILFGQRVRVERLKQGLSQELLAEKAGVHRTYIGMIERAEKNITLINIEKIAKALGVEIGTLLKGTNR